MVGYDEIVDYLQEAVDTGAMDLEEAQAIEEAAAERYGVVDEEEGFDLTFESAAQSVSILVDEATGAMTDEETLDDLKLRVYEAADDGYISDIEKDTYLGFLDINNYQ